MRVFRPDSSGIPGRWGTIELPGRDDIKIPVYSRAGYPQGPMIEAAFIVPDGAEGIPALKRVLAACRVELVQLPRKVMTLDEWLDVIAE
jgi:hypothetical protein